MDFLQYIKPELLILLPVLYGIGAIIKKIPKIPDWLIPFILLLVSVIITFIYVLAMSGFAFTGELIATSLIQGICLALATVGSNQLYKQATQKRNEDNESN